MKSLLFFCGLIVVIKAYSDAEIKAWDEFKLKYNKTYDAQEDPKRFEVFIETLKLIEKESSKADGSTYEIGLNHLADWYPEELERLFGYNNPPLNARSGQLNPIRYVPPYNARIPPSLDWRNYGAITRVRNQGQCNSCWTFSAIGALEAQHFFKTGQLIEFSEQNLLDCIQGSECHGNWPSVAFEYIKNHGVASEYYYPYKGVNGVGGQCWANPNMNMAVPVRGYYHIDSGNEDHLLKAVALMGPVSVAIDIEHNSFKIYTRGIYYEPTCRTDKAAHAVLVVGYGTEDGVDYWIVKNSWDDWWGEQGYFRIRRNWGNHCGIASWASIPMV